LFSTFFSSGRLWGQLPAMAVTSFDSKFSLQQDAVARLGDKAGKQGKMSKEDQKNFQKSSFMQMVEKVNALHKQISQSRDKARAETDPSFQPKDEDFKVERAFKFDKVTNYYKTLGVMEYETQANIKKAYRSLSVIYHPDKTAGLDDDAKETYRRIFIELKNANTVLSDNVMRRQYDSARDKEIASCEVRGTKMPEKKDQFDPRNAEAVLARGGPRCAQAVRSDGTVSASIPAKTVEIPLEAHLEQFVFGGQEANTQSLNLVDEESRDLGILEFEEQDRDFEVEIPPGAPEPFVADFPGQGNQHEDAPADNIKFLVTAKPHDIVERSGSDLRLKAELGAGPGPYLSADSPCVRGRHVVLWGSNPFFCSCEAASVQMEVRIHGAGIGTEGAFCFTLRPEAAGAPAAGAEEVPPALRRRLDRQLEAEKPPCEVTLYPLGEELALATEPACSLQVYANLWEGPNDYVWGTKPCSIFAISLSSKDASSEDSEGDWERLKSSLVPLLQASGFALFGAGRSVLPRPLSNEPVFAEEAYGQPQGAAAPDVPWRVRGNEAFARGDYWMAVGFYSQGLEELPESGEEQSAAVLLSNRSVTFHRLQDYEAALADARRATELAPTWCRAWTRASAAAAAKGSDDDLEEAVVAHAKTVELEPNGMSVEGLDGFVRALTRPSEPAAQKAKDKAKEALSAKEWAKAIAELTVGVARLDPQDPGHNALRSELLRGRASAFTQLRDWGAAAGDAYRAVEAKPQSAKARTALGVALLGMRQTEQAYSAFAEAVKKDHESASARRGRDYCLTEMALGRSARMEARKQWRLADGERPKASSRVFAISDIHLDHSQRQFAWIMSIDGEKFKEDVIIVAGNLGIRMNSLVGGLSLLKSKFRRVFYTVGNDEMRITGHEHPDSIAKMQAVFAACDEIGVDVCPAAISEEVYIVPLTSWYNAEFDWTDPRPDPDLNTDGMCRWPIDANEQVWKYMLKLNEANAQTELWGYAEKKTIITFSHFLPRRDLPFHYATDIGMKAAKSLGCEAIEYQLRMIRSKLHVFGHSHFLHAEDHDDVLYVQQPLGYPQERLMIHRDAERALLMMVHDGQEPVMQTWNPVTDKAAEQQPMAWEAP